MNRDINLVSADSVNALTNKRVERFKTIGTFSLLVIGVLSVLLFVLNKFLSPQSIIDEQNQIISSMSSMSGQQTKLFLFSQRLNDAGTIIAKRANYDIVISSILSQAPSDLSVGSLSVEKKKVSMIVTSASLLSINTFIDNLKAMVDKKQLIKTVKVNNLNLGSVKTGYVLSLDIDSL